MCSWDCHGQNTHCDHDDKMAESTTTTEHVAVPVSNVRFTRCRCCLVSFVHLGVLELFLLGVVDSAVGIPKLEPGVVQLCL